MSNSKTKFSLNASTVKILFSIGLFVSTVAGASGFLYMNSFIQNQVNDLATKKKDAEASDNTVASLQSLQRKIRDNQAIIDKIDTLSEDNKFPEFSIVDSIAKYASANGLSGVSYNYDSSTSAAPASGQQPATSGATPPTASSVPSPVTGKTISVTVSFDRDVSYTQLLKFLSDIERTTDPKLTIRNVATSPAESSGRVDVEPIVIEMYIK